VRRVEREACTVQRPDGKVVKIHFRQLMCETPLSEPRASKARARRARRQRGLV
jgi:hypothetical protein